MPGNPISRICLSSSGKAAITDVLVATGSVWVGLTDSSEGVDIVLIEEQEADSNNGIKTKCSFIMLEASELNCNTCWIGGYRNGLHL